MNSWPVPRRGAVPSPRALTTGRDRSTAYASGTSSLEIGTDQELERNRQYVAGRAAGYHAGLMAEVQGGVS